MLSVLLMLLMLSVLTNQLKSTINSVVESVETLLLNFFKTQDYLHDRNNNNHSHPHSHEVHKELLYLSFDLALT